MITRERLEKSEFGRGLLALMSRLDVYEVTDWGNDDSQTKGENRPGDRRKVSTGMNNANVVTSLLSDEPVSFDAEPRRHALVLDIDHPAWLVPSTTPGHYHLYVDVPGGIEPEKYSTLLTALADAGVIEWGYAAASIARGWTSVRLPWIQKKTGAKQHD